MPFRTEKELFETALNSSYFQQLGNPAVFLVEPQGLFGIPDLVIAKVKHSKAKKRVLVRKTMAFEMKLHNWKRALIQAFRYQAFATMSFVVLDDAYIQRATKNIEKFRIANIGLLSINKDGVVISHYLPQPNEPYSVQLRITFNHLVLASAEPRCPENSDGISAVVGSSLGVRASTRGIGSAADTAGAV